MKNIVNISKKRRAYVYAELSKEMEDKKLSNSQKSKIMKKAWKDAKNKYK